MGENKRVVSPLLPIGAGVNKYPGLQQSQRPVGVTVFFIQFERIFRLDLLSCAICLMLDPSGAT